MKAFTAAAIALSAAALGFGAAHAAALPRYQVGEVFVFDNGRVEQVKEVRGGRVVWAARSGRNYQRSVNPIVPILDWSFRGQTGSRTVLGNPDKLWPLAAGRKEQFRTLNITTDAKRRQRRSLHLWSCTVHAQERIAVPAGRFMAYPIRCDRFSHSSMRVLERLVWHYSPEVGHYVRREARDMADGTVDVYSLYAALPPHAANPVRVEALALSARPPEPAKKAQSRTLIRPGRAS